MKWGVLNLNTKKHVRTKVGTRIETIVREIREITVEIIEIENLKKISMSHLIIAQNQRNQLDHRELKQMKS